MSKSKQSAIAPSKDSWMKALVSAIAKNADKPEFQKASQAIEDWGNKYPRSYRALLKTSEFWLELEEALEIRVEN